MSPSWPSAPRYAPYDKGRFQFTLGIRELDPAEWIEIDDQYAPQLAEKRRLLAERPGEVSGAVPGSLWAQAECLDMLLDHLARHRPDTITAGGPILRVPGTGDVYDRRDFADRPLDLPGRLDRKSGGEGRMVSLRVNFGGSPT